MTGLQDVTVRGLVHGWPEGFLDHLPDHQWLVLNCRVRHEKQLMSTLRKMDIPGVIFYEERLRRYRGKGVQKSLVPLLHGYVFCHADANQRYDIMATDRVAYSIEVPDPKRLRLDLSSLITLINSGDKTAPLVVKPELKPGKEVRIVSGTFAGFVGIISKRRGQTELIVNIQVLGHSVTATLPAETAELMTEPV